MTIREMAELVARNYGVHVVVNIPSDVQNLGYAAPTGCRLNIDRISRLGWRPQYTLRDCYRRMITVWEEQESLRYKTRLAHGT